MCSQSLMVLFITSSAVYLWGIYRGRFVTSSDTNAKFAVPVAGGDGAVSILFHQVVDAVSGAKYGRICASACVG